MTHEQAQAQMEATASVEIDDTCLKCSGTGKYRERYDCYNCSGTGKDAKRVEREHRKAKWAEDSARMLHLNAEVGEKVIISGEVTYADTYYTGFGHSRLIVVLVDGDKPVKVSTSRDWAFDINKGDDIQFTATVKQFTEYRGVKQTVVKNPTINRMDDVEED